MRTRIVGVSLFVAALASMPARAAEDIFLLINTIPGESVKAGHLNWIDVFALSHGLSVPTGGGPQFQELSLLKATDKSTPLLFDAAARTLNLGLVTIEVCGTPVSGPSRCYYKLELSNATVSAAQLSGAAACTSPGTCAPAQTESFSFTFTRIKTYYSDPGGAVTSRCWDLQTASAC
jgi:type VI secretion system secreted protein Hcp